MKYYLVLATGAFGLPFTVAWSKNKRKALSFKKKFFRKCTIIAVNNGEILNNEQFDLLKIK